MADEAEVRRVFEGLAPVLDERAQRLWAAATARAHGRGGVSLVARATGIARSTIQRGLQELTQVGPCHVKPNPQARVRRPGGGRKASTTTDPTLLRDLEALVDPATRGDPMSPLRWTNKSTRQLAQALREQGHAISHETVSTLLREPLGYSLQGLRKTKEGNAHPDRDAQFQHINQEAAHFQERGQPVISVDTKKKELVGDFKNGGREWQPEGQPEAVRVHDFVDPELGKAIPYGVYDPAQNAGWVSVGTDHDTSAFAVQTIRTWWERMGRATYPDARELLVTADAGGSNGSRNRLWKTQLQRLADETGLAISVCHFPPGTSKWNKIEHRLFCHITQNWRGRPLASHEVVVNLIGNTRTTTGLRVQAGLDRETYPTGVKISDQELAAVALAPATFRGEWNYTISPRETGSIVS
jgi:Rhodopirellula transposase DDE domain